MKSEKDVAEFNAAYDRYNFPPPRKEIKPILQEIPVDMKKVLYAV